MSALTVMVHATNAHVTNGLEALHLFGFSLTVMLAALVVSAMFK